MRAALALLLAACGGPAPTDAGATGMDAAIADAGGPDAGLSGACGSAFTPTGCRAVPSSAPALASRRAWRNLHADATGTDEVERVVGPVLAEAWDAEPNTFNVTGPVFDSAGHLYFAPLSPAEAVVLISLDAETGARRFAIPNPTGSLPGAGTPMVAVDPASGDEQVFLGLHDRVIAVTTAGETIWDEPTGLTVADGDPPVPVFGVQLHPQADAIVGLTGDAQVYVHDRATGAPRLAAPFALPGERSPPGGAVGMVPESILADVLLQLSPLIAPREGVDPGSLVGTLLGNEAEVANFFSIDPHDGTIWIAATAPDDEDGAADGVSALGALYALALVPDGDLLRLEERCHASFEGGTASTPSLRASGGRVYVGDNVGSLIAIEPDCSEAWRVDLGAQIIGSIAVASDGGALYAATLEDVIRVDDEGASGAVRWRARPRPPRFARAGEDTFNVNLVAIGENGLALQVGAGVALMGAPLLRTVGVGVIDRETGDLRAFAEGLDETLAVMSTAPDGGVCLGGSPLRRAIYRAVFGLDMAEPLRGGITCYRPADPGATLVDALCAAERRAGNAAAVEATCPDSAAADREVVRGVIEQARGALPGAPVDEATRAAIEAAIDEAEAALDADLAAAARALTRGREAI